MRRRFVSVLTTGTLWVAAFAAAPNAQVFYEYPSAPPVSDAKPAVGGGLGFAGDQLRLLGFGRFNLNEDVDLGLELSLDRRTDLGVFANDSSWRFGLGGDIKRAIRPEQALPFDLALQAGFGFQTGGDITNIDVPFGAVASRPVTLENGRRFVPYGGLYLVIRHRSLDLPAPFDVSDTDLDLDLRVGASFELFDAGDAFATLHISEDVMLFFGFNAGI